MWTAVGVPVSCVTSGVLGADVMDDEGIIEERESVWDLLNKVF